MIWKRPLLFLSNSIEIITFCPWTRGDRWSRFPWMMNDLRVKSSKIGCSQGFGQRFTLMRWEVNVELVQDEAISTQKRSLTFIFGCRTLIRVVQRVWVFVVIICKRIGTQIKIQLTHRRASLYFMRSYTMCILNPTPNTAKVQSRGKQLTGWPLINLTCRNSDNELQWASLLLDEVE